MGRSEPTGAATTPYCSLDVAQHNNIFKWNSYICKIPNCNDVMLHAVKYILVICTVSAVTRKVNVYMSVGLKPKASWTDNK